jgi:hypothetical protein
MLALPVPRLDEWLAVAVELEAGQPGAATSAIVRYASQTGLPRAALFGFLALVARLAADLARSVLGPANPDRPAGLTLADALALHWEVSAGHRGPGCRRTAPLFQRLDPADRARHFHAAMQAAEAAVNRWQEAMSGRLWSVDPRELHETCPLTPEQVEALLDRAS